MISGSEKKAMNGSAKAPFHVYTLLFNVLLEFNSIGETARLGRSFKSLRDYQTSHLK